MKYKKILMAFFLSGTTLSVFSQEVGSFDILGIKLGMTREQAEAAIKLQIPNAKIESTEFYRESAGISKSLAKIKFIYENRYSENSWISLSFLPISGKIFSISRQEKTGGRYKPETWTAFETLQKAFDKKYGAPTFTSRFGTPPAYYIVFDKWHQGEDRKFLGFADSFEVALNDYTAVNAEIKQITLKATEVQKQQRDQGSKNTAPKL